MALEDAPVAIEKVAIRMFHAAGGPALPFGGKLFETLSGERMYLDLSRNDRFSPLEFWGLLLLGSAVAAAGAFAPARRDAVGPRRAAVWTAAALILGIPALLTLSCLDRRAVRVKCPACGRKRPVGRDACPRCGAAFPEPAPLGTEIIDGLRP